MMNVSTLTVLLVCVILECAHSASFERGWERFSPRSKRSTVNRVSIVESWDSVCEEVCRAGYGGPGCGVVGCNAQSTLGNSEKFQAICPNLCENALGGTKCDCALSPMNPNLSSARNSLCSVTCSWRTSLSGCSKCVKAVGTTNRDDSSTTIDGITDDAGITDDYGTTNTTEEQETTTEEYSTDEEDTTTDENSTSESDEDDSTTEEATTTTSTTTTTQATTTTRTTTQATTTTTPNWESLCEALCRNGEGGSLCNCDIPPFF